MQSLPLMENAIFLLERSLLYTKIRVSVGYREVLSLNFVKLLSKCIGGLNIAYSG